jgi:hypothetical protein
MSKKQITFKIDSEVYSELDRLLGEIHQITGISPIRQSAIETAIKRYFVELDEIITRLKVGKQ